MNYFPQVLCQTDGHIDPVQGLAMNARSRKGAGQAMYEGQDAVPKTAGRQGDCLGPAGAVTEFVDHERRARSREYRLDGARFGRVRRSKQRALDHALLLAS